MDEANTFYENDRWYKICTKCNNRIQFRNKASIMTFNRNMKEGQPYTCAICSRNLKHQQLLEMYPNVKQVGDKWGRLCKCGETVYTKDFAKAIFNTKADNGCQYCFRRGIRGENWSQIQKEAQNRKALSDQCIASSSFNAKTRAKALFDRLEAAGCHGLTDTYELEKILKIQ